MGPVHFDYVENMGMNAFAFESGGHDFVGLYAGTIITIYRFFASLLAYPRLLMSIGNPLTEVEWISHTDDPKLIVSRIPKDQARRSFAHLLATLAIDFLFAHEIGHLMNGHVKLIGKSKGSTFLAEFDSTRKTSEEYLMRQALEMDADSFAVGQGVTTALGRASKLDSIGPPDWRQWYSTPRQALFAWTLAIYGLFRLFFRGEVNLSDLEIAIHPPPNIRLVIALGTMEEILIKRGLEELRAQLEPIFTEVMKTVETGHALITATPLDPSCARQISDPRVGKHIEKIFSSWKILRPELLPLNRGGRLAD
jgi:hypothetical protein